MARFSKMATAATPSTPLPAERPTVAAECDERAVEVARDAVRPTPPAAITQSERLQALQRVTIRADNRELAAGAVREAARLRCLKHGNGGEDDRKATGLVARFLMWSSFGDVIDPARAFTRANVDEYLIWTKVNSERSLRQRRYILYGIGRELHPQQFPRSHTVPAPRRKRLPAASMAEVARLEHLIPRLPARLAQRAQALFDLSYGAGARAGDFRSLRGTSIISMSVDGRAIAVVALPNRLGGVRQVPVVNPAIAARLLSLSVAVGSGLVLSPKTEQPERNIVNRTNGDLRRHGHAGMNHLGLRNRWILDLAATVPAALLLQLADVSDLRVLVDQRPLLPTYTVRHAITTLQENQR